jgi:hypothetical protein
VWSEGCSRCSPRCSSSIPPRAHRKRQEGEGAGVQGRVRGSRGLKGSRGRGWEGVKGRRRRRQRGSRGGSSPRSKEAGVRRWCVERVGVRRMQYDRYGDWWMGTYVRRAAYCLLGPMYDSGSTAVERADMHQSIHTYEIVHQSVTVAQVVCASSTARSVLIDKKKPAVIYIQYIKYSFTPEHVHTEGSDGANGLASSSLCLRALRGCQAPPSPRLPAPPCRAI